MADDRCARLFDEAATAGLRITGLDGWNQTRLAGSLGIRREVVNAIINRDPVAEPSDTRPRMVEACRKIIAFAAVISRKDDAVVPREVALAERLDDDAQAYECHKLRLRRVVEDAIGGGAFIEGIYRVGELSSQAINASPRFRVKMTGNVVTAIQRLLDKPQSRSIPADLLDHNLRRLALAEWAARRAVRAIPASVPADDRNKAIDDLAYIRGQVGYAMMFNGLLVRNAKAVRRGRRRLWRAATDQPAPDYGHWSNLLRAVNDLMANDHAAAYEWALAVVDLARKQQGAGFAVALSRLRDKGEIGTLLGYWEGKGQMTRIRALLDRGQNGATQEPAAAVRRKARRGSTAAAILLLVGLLTAASPARAGDGKELSARGNLQQRSSAMPSAPSNAPSRFQVGAGQSSGTNGSIPVYPPRLGLVPSPQPGDYPVRQPSSVGRGAAADPQPGAIARPAWAQRPVTQRRNLVTLAARNARALGLIQDEEPDATTPEDQTASAEVEATIDADESDEAPPARPAQPSARRPNRLYPLIVVRPNEFRSASRSAPPRQAAKVEAADPATPARASVASNDG